MWTQRLTLKDDLSASQVTEHMIEVYNEEIRDPLPDNSNPTIPQFSKELFDIVGATSMEIKVVPKKVFK